MDPVFSWILVPGKRKSHPNRCTRGNLVLERSLLSKALALRCPCWPWTEGDTTSDVCSRSQQQIPSEVVSIGPHPRLVVEPGVQLPVSYEGHLRCGIVHETVNVNDLWSSVRPLPMNMWQARLSGSIPRPTFTAFPYAIFSVAKNLAKSVPFGVRWLRTGDSRGVACAEHPSGTGKFRSV